MAGSSYLSHRTRWSGCGLIVSISLLLSNTSSAGHAFVVPHSTSITCVSPVAVVRRRQCCGRFLSSSVSCTPADQRLRNLRRRDHLQQRQLRYFASFPLQQAADDNGRTMELDNEEPLSLLFQRALVLHRAGSIDKALENYQLFCKAAQQCEVDPFQYAEVHVNMGAIYIKKGDSDSAKESFNEALKHREIGTAHVNLAVLQLQLASSLISPQAGLECLQVAKGHCQKAVALNDDPPSFETASRLLVDIDRMMNQAAGGGGK